MFSASLNLIFSGNFAVVRKTVKQISESFCVHQAVFDCSFEHFKQLRMALAGMVQSSFHRGIEFVAEARIITLDLPARGPVEGAVCWQTSTYWIDAKCKKLVKCRVKGAEPKGTAAQEIPIEGVHMA